MSRARYIVCAYCRRWVRKRKADYNRALAIGARLFCGRRCAGLVRRKHKTKAQRKLEKRLYDMVYRAKNLAAIKAREAAYFRRTYDPAKAAVERKKRMPRHVEYCRQPKYKVYKRAYDARRRAKEYGPFADAYRLTIELNREIKERMTNAEVKTANDTITKRQRRAAAEGDRAIRDRNRPSPRSLA